MGSPFLSGHTIDPLRNGVEIFPAMLEAIRNAERSVEFETFVYWSGDIARKFAEALADAARRGVQVRVLLDAAGCLPMPDEVRETLRESEAEVREFGTLRSWRFWEIDHRTHRKILVCDGRVAFTGGVGIATEWEGDARSPDEWRETHFRIRGPAASLLRGVFLQHWLAAGDDSADLSLLPDPVPSGTVDRTSGNASVQTVASSGVGRWSEAQTLFRALIRVARQSIRITTGYFVPEEDVVELLVDAAHRGVSVDIIHPGPHTDHRVSNLAGEVHYPRLLEAGVRIWRYQKTMIHAKIVLVDGQISCIGSPNLNRRSALKDDEVALVIEDPRLNADLTRDFEADRADSRRVDASDAPSHRSWWRRALSALTRPIRSQV